MYKCISLYTENNKMMWALKGPLNSLRTCVLSVHSSECNALSVESKYFFLQIHGCWKFRAFTSPWITRERQNCLTGLVVCFGGLRKGGHNKINDVTNWQHLLPSWWWKVFMQKYFWRLSQIASETVPEMKKSVFMGVFIINKDSQWKKSLAFFFSSRT